MFCLSNSESFSQSGNREGVMTIQAQAVRIVWGLCLIAAL